MSPDCADYDMIVYKLTDINQTNIDQAKENRNTRLAKAAHEVATQTGEKRRVDDFAPGIENIKNTDVIFRLMTWDHVPTVDIAPKKTVELDEDDQPVHTEYDDDAVKPANTKYVKCNFPPFQHFKVNEDNIPVCVGKSHWVGDLQTGHWSKDHGMMTRTLANMFIKLCEKYATRFNWRSYTYNDEMRSQALLQLSQIGLQFDEGKSQNPFAYYTATISNSFIRVLNIEKRNQNLRDDIMEINNLNPSYTRQNESYGGYDDN